MKYRTLGKTGLSVSEIGLGAEWLERHNAQEVKEIIDRCEEAGINILDCWMSEPNVRSNIGKAIAGKRDRWIIQGSVPPGRTDSMCAPVRWIRQRKLLETCWPGWVQTISTWE